MEMWTPPTFSEGKIPQVTPGTSGDQQIGGDFPLDQVVIDRKYPQTTLKDDVSLIFSRASSRHTSPFL